MNNRIKEIRKSLSLTQEAFSERIGLKRNSIAQIESGVRSPSNQVIIAICREFHVRREWLESGIGDMFPPESEDDELIDEILAGEDEFIKAVIRGIAKTPGGWEKMREVFNAIKAELDKEKKPEG